MNKEEELKEEVDRYERQNQEAYDLEVENEIKRKREAEAKYKQLPLFTRLNDAIEGKLDQFGQFVSEAAEDKPGITDDIVRGGLNTLQTIGNLPVIKQLGQAEEAIVGGVRNLAERQDLIDPRSFTYSTRIGLGFAADKGIRKVVQTGKKVAAVAKAEQIMRAQNPALKGVLMQSIDPTEGIKVGLPSPERAADYLRRLSTDMYFKNPKTIVGKLPNQTEALEIAENLLKHVDEGEKGLIPGWIAERPTTRYSGNRMLDYVRSDGTPSQLYFNYSGSGGRITAIDYLKRMEVKLARDNWNVSSNSSLGQMADRLWKSAKTRNKQLRGLLESMRVDNPEEFRRIFGTKGVWYVEHLHAQKSPFWDKPRQFSPRDPVNLMALGERNFPKLKTNLENHMYTDKWQAYATKKYGTRVYLDYNPDNKTLQLRRADTDDAIGSIIDGDTPQSQWKKTLANSEANIPQGDISDINPDLDPVIDATDRITATTAARIPDVGSQPGIPKANVRANVSKEIADEIAGYQAEIDQARKNLDLYYSQFEPVPVKEGVPTAGSKITKTKELTTLKLTGPNSVNSNRQIIADRLQKIKELEDSAQGSLFISKPGVTQSSGTGMMTNVQQEVPAVQPGKKVKRKRVRKKKVDE
mgnify:CR=1 FL=1